jgi:hypothetical protein
VIHEFCFARLSAVLNAADFPYPTASPLPEVGTAQEVLVLKVQVALGLADVFNVSTVNRHVNALQVQANNRHIQESDNGIKQCIDIQLNATHFPTT